MSNQDEKILGPLATTVQIPVPPASRVVPISKPKNHAVMWIAAGAIMLMIGIGIGLVLRKYSPKKITSYEECVKANGNAIQPMYPGVCTANGQRFVQLSKELTYEENLKINSPDPTANWKTYKNDVIGFEFKYPSLWIIKDNSDNSNSNVNLEITSEDLNSKLEYRGGDFPVPVYMQGGKMHLNVDINPFYRSVEEFKKAESKNFLKTIQIPFSNEVLYRIEKYYKEYNSSEVEFLMENTPKRNTPISFILTMGYSEKEGVKYNNLFDQILSTFKFIDQTSSVDMVSWKTYSNIKYGFKFQYPPEARIDILGQSPNEQYKVIYMGQKQRNSGRTQTDLLDGYIFYVSIRADAPQATIETVSQQTLNGGKENCYEQTIFSDITSAMIDGRSAKTYNVQKCLGDYTETYVSNGKKILEITQIYVGESPDKENYKKITDQILSTFKFTN